MFVVFAAPSAAAAEDGPYSLQYSAAAVVAAAAAEMQAYVGPECSAVVASTGRGDPGGRDDLESQPFPADSSSAGASVAVIVQPADYPSSLVEVPSWLERGSWAGLLEGFVALEQQTGLQPFLVEPAPCPADWPGWVAFPVE